MARQVMIVQARGDNEVLLPDGAEVLEVLLGKDEEKDDVIELVVLADPKPRETQPYKLHIYNAGDLTPDFPGVYLGQVDGQYVFRDEIPFNPETGYQNRVTPNGGVSKQPQRRR